MPVKSEWSPCRLTLMPYGLTLARSIVFIIRIREREREEGEREREELFMRHNRAMIACGVEYFRAPSFSLSLIQWRKSNARAIQYVSPPPPSLPLSPFVRRWMNRGTTKSESHGSPLRETDERAGPTFMVILFTVLL